jgi:hypothetical protein
MRTITGDFAVRWSGSAARGRLARHAVGNSDRAAEKQRARHGAGARADVWSHYQNNMTVDGR